MKILKTTNSSIINILIFILKVWILTSIISSPLFILNNQYANGIIINFQETIFDKSFWQAYFFVLLFSLSLSIPAMLILGFIIKLSTNNKLVLALISVILVFGTFYFTGFISLKNYTFDILYPPFIYSIVISILILTIDLGKKN